MLDHLHLLWVWAVPSSDQLKAKKFLRRHLPLNWQKQAHDHVLREEERERVALADTCMYLRKNPVRANLLQSPNNWPLAGSLVPGFLDLDPWESDTFWRCFLTYRKALTGEA